MIGGSGTSAGRDQRPADPDNCGHGVPGLYTFFHAASDTAATMTLKVFAGRPGIRLHLRVTPLAVASGRKCRSHSGRRKSISPSSAGGAGRPRWYP